MGALNEYQKWLTNLQRQPSFLNNYWCAMLAHDMEKSSNTDEFKIPYFIVEKELIREDRNIHLTNRDQAYVSPTLKHWLIHLLKESNGETNSTNYEQVLRDVLDNIPGRHQPLTPSTSFHCLPSECKLWILYMLWRKKRPALAIRTIFTDKSGNSYFIVPGCRLYVCMATSEKASLPIDEARLWTEPWGQLYRFVHNQHCRLLCENQEGWNVVLRALRYYKQIGLCHAIVPEITAKLTEQNLIKTMRDEQLRVFEENLHKLEEDEAPKKLSKNQKKKLKKIAAQEAQDKADALETELNDVNVKEPVPTSTPRPAPTQQKVGRCWNFPQCPLHHTCKYSHPKIPCTKFPNCKLGWQCPFRHHVCENDANCVNPSCPYEHYHSMPTYYRVERQPETLIQFGRPVAAVSPTVRKVSDQTVNEQQLRSSPTPVSGQVTSQPKEKKRRCQYFPGQCRKGDACDYFHPTEKCLKVAAGKSCVRLCNFLHGQCKKDGNCDDLNCIFDHFKSKPVVDRRIAARNQGSLSRATSYTNLSMISGRSRRAAGSMSRASSTSNLSVISGRSRRVSFAGSDDSRVSSRKPKGILRSPVASTRERCLFGAQCAKVRCDFAHPKDPCPAFPKCPNGLACIYLHQVCKNDGVCIKKDCDYEHILPHKTGNRWCKKGSLCKTIGCSFFHPKECIGRCPSPDGCWMYHRPGAAQAAQSAPKPVPNPPRTAVPKGPQPPKQQHQQQQQQQQQQPPAYAAPKPAQKTPPPPAPKAATKTPPTPKPRQTPPAAAAATAKHPAAAAATAKHPAAEAPKEKLPPVPPRHSSAQTPPIPSPVQQASPQEHQPPHQAPFGYGPGNGYGHAPPPFPPYNYGPQYPPGYYGPPHGGYYNGPSGYGGGYGYGQNGYGGGFGGYGPRPGDAPPPAMFPPPPPYASMSPGDREMLERKDRQ